MTTKISDSMRETTALDATKLSGNLPALNGASLTSLSAGNLSGTLPAISGASLTNLFGGFPVGASAYVTGGQAISNNCACTLIGNTEVYDPNSNYNTSTGTYTVPSGQAGKYIVCGHISIPVVDPLLLGMGIKVDGTAKIFQGQYGGADTGGQELTIILDLSVGEAVTWYCHHKAGSTKTTEASAYGTGMSIQRIA